MCQLAQVPVQHLTIQLQGNTNAYSGSLLSYLVSIILKNHSDVYHKSNIENILHLQCMFKHNSVIVCQKPYYISVQDLLAESVNYFFIVESLFALLYSLCMLCISVYLENLRIMARIKRMLGAGGRIIGRNSEQNNRPKNQHIVLRSTFKCDF